MNKANIAKLSAHGPGAAIQEALHLCNITLSEEMIAVCLIHEDYLSLSLQFFRFQMEMRLTFNQVITDKYLIQKTTEVCFTGVGWAVNPDRSLLIKSSNDNNLEDSFNHF